MEQELDVLSKTDHPHMVRVFELLQDETSFYIVTELVRGGELYDHIIKVKRVSEAQAADILRQILLAVNYMHQQSIVHRDIKPENILLAPEEQASPAKLNLKLTDFGFACFYRRERGLRQVLGYISKEETARMRQSFTDKIDGLSALRDAVEKKVRTCGYINAIDKRKIYVDGVYKSMNYLLQSTAAVVAKTWMVLANKRLKEKYNNKFNQLAFVHDELQFQVDSSIDKEEFIAIVKQAAADAGKELGLRVPVVADAKSGYSWAETH